jgi:NAD(P)-dependent dehydrogenase (short-subunit alcohol dehydrogenase family)
MSKTILIVGYGPGVSTAVAERFGAEGFSAALVARNAERLSAGARALKDRGVPAAAFPADAGDPAALRSVVDRARAELGPIAVVQWNAFHAPEPADLLETDPLAVRDVFNVAVAGLLAVVQAAAPDLKANAGAVLVTNGAFAEPNPVIDAYAIQQHAVGLSLANAAKHKLVGLLAQRLKPEGVYVGEVMIAGVVKGTPFDQGGQAIDGATVAGRFWDLYQAREEIRARVS